jgi:hypothetical protein
VVKTRVTAEAGTLEAEIPEAATLAAATLVEETPMAAAVVVTPEVEAEEIPTSDSGTEPISHD